MLVRLLHMVPKALQRLFASEEISDVYMVRSLIEDTKDVRFHKIGTGLEKLSSWTYAMKVTEGGMMLG
ncbi:DNA replication complex GINS protein PSF2 [Tanacetum coccineum]